MGIRIHKDIGYIIDTSSDIFHTLFKDDYHDTLDVLWDDDDAQHNFFKQLKAWEFPEHAILGKLEVKLITDSFKKKAKKIELYQLIKSIGYDDCDYLLFGNARTIKAARYDDLIDYYESQDSETHVNYLMSGLDSYSKFIYKGGIEDKVEASILEHFPDFEVGRSYDYNTVYALLPTVGHGNHSYAKPLIESGCFHPAIDDLAYPLAKLAGILKDDVSELDFKLALRPAIVTHWC